MLLKGNKEKKWEIEIYYNARIYPDKRKINNDMDFEWYSHLSADILKIRCSHKIFYLEFFDLSVFVQYILEMIKNYVDVNIFYVNFAGFWSYFDDFFYWRVVWWDFLW